MVLTQPLSRRYVTAAALLLSSLAGAGANYPSLGVEISADHPLFLFEMGGTETVEPLDYAAFIEEGWQRLDGSLRPYALPVIGGSDDGASTWPARYGGVLPVLQGLSIPVVIEVARNETTGRLPAETVAALLQRFTVVKGVQVTGLAFDVYDPALPEDRNVAWLIDVIEAAARHGRFVYMPLDALHWPRIMSNLSAAPLCEKLRACADYVVPGALHRGDHHIPRMSAILGLWLEGGAGHWGIAADGRWYSDAHFVSPGVFGNRPDNGTQPSAIYRAMILNGAMAGATVYSFAPDRDLWIGAARHHWDEAIAPTLKEVLAKGLIARREFVLRRTPVAYQLAPAATPLDFHVNLRDIDPILGEGLLVHGAYGMDRPGQVPELILNRGDHFWVPLLSSHAPAAAAEAFRVVVQPGRMTTAGEWSVLLDEHHPRENENEAFVTRVGRGLFIMNSQENTVAPQRFSVRQAPVPVGGIEARREGASVLVTWPFREGDVSYNVHRRILPATAFDQIAENLDDRRFQDTGVSQEDSVAYAVTALTSETDAFSGTVGYGEYLALSTVESRIAEEAILSPMLTSAGGTPWTPPSPPAEAAKPWWPDYSGLEGQALGAAQAIVERIEAWDRAIVAADLNAVIDLYSTDYEDPQGWRFQYAQRAYQWLFERYRGHRMARQIRRWDCSALETEGRVNVLLYCRITAYALTDQSGRIADRPLAIPRNETNEVWVTWSNADGVWRIVSTNPAVPNFRGLLADAAGPYDEITPGVDGYEACGW